MEETIKGIEVIAYKGIGFDMTCREFKYELGKSYKTDKVKLCECGFHACLNPRDVLDYYPKYHSRYFKVNLSGEITKCNKSNTKVAATEITILEEINIDEVINNTEWWKTENVIDLLYWLDGFARVQRANSDWNFIDAKGNYLSDEWFKSVDYFNKDGFARVQRANSDWNFIDAKGNYLSDEWFRYVDYFNKVHAEVQRTNGEWAKIDKTGNLIKILQ